MKPLSSQDGRLFPVTLPLFRRNMKLPVFVLLLVLSICYASTDFYIDGQFDSNRNSPSIRLKDTGFTLTGKVVLGNPSHACSKLKNADEISGNILYVEKRDGKFL